jgi:glycosyltransferase involved in cell wall biosynthesis
MPHPKLSILLPVRDAAAYLLEAIASLETQTFRDWECLVIEDGSTDASPEILKSWQQRDARVQILEGGGQGIVHALNLALAEATAPMVARMDADDIALPTRLEKQLAFMSAHPDVVACGTGVLMIDPAGRALCPIRPVIDHNTIVEKLSKGGATAMVHPSLMVQTAALRKLGGYREAFCHVEDYDLYLRLSEVGQLANLDEILLYYRQHPASANVVRRERQCELRLEALNDYRERKGHPRLEQLEFGRAHLNTLTDLYADWSMKAALAGNRTVAYRYAILANAREFWRPKRWRLLWQVYALSRKKSESS